MTLVAGGGHAAPAPAGPLLPRPRGPLSEIVISALRTEPVRPMPVPSAAALDVDPLVDDDFQLALYCCYELHYRGFAGVSDQWEWAPALLAVRAELERAFERRLFEVVGRPAERVVDVRAALRDVVASGADGPSLSSFMESDGTVEQMREFCIHRSAYQLKEADPHTWALPRITGTAKAAMVEIQADEYGGGDEAAVHATLFATTMEALGLNPTYGAYLDRLPGSTLATVNLVSMLGLHRRWRGALVGHLALFEMTSVVPMGRYSRALGRLGFGPDARRFYDVHVAADAVHEVVALERMAAGLAESEPALAGAIVFGANAVMAVEAAFASSLLDAWGADRSSLLR